MSAILVVDALLAALNVGFGVYAIPGKAYGLASIHFALAMLMVLLAISEMIHPV